MRPTALFLPAFLAAAGAALAGPAEKAYRGGKLEEARDLYEERLAEEPGDLRARYNLGNVEYRAEDLQAAEEAYQASLGSEDFRLRSNAAHNLGNVRLLAGDLDGAIEAYQDALRAQPGSEDSRYNLELALRLKEITPPQPQQQQASPQSSESQEEGEQEQQERQPQPDQPQNEQQDQEGRQDPQEEPQQGEQEPQPSGPSPEDEQEPSASEPEGSAEESADEESMQPVPPPSEEDYTERQAERVLDGLAEEERKLIADRMRAQGRSVNVEKDW